MKHLDEGGISDELDHTDQMVSEIIKWGSVICLMREIFTERMDRWAWRNGSSSQLRCGRICVHKLKYIGVSHLERGSYFLFFWRRVNKRIAFCP